jgi:hypothetical protein
MDNAIKPAFGDIIVTAKQVGGQTEFCIHDW